MRIELDTGRCCGYGNCVTHADDIFELDDQTGVARLRRHTIPLERLTSVQFAAADCPATAISIVDAGP